MENDAAAVAAYDYDLALEAGEPRHLGFRFRLPRLRLRDPRLSAAAAVALWGVAGLLSTTVPDLAANSEHVLLYFHLPHGWSPAPPARSRGAGPARGGPSGWSPGGLDQGHDLQGRVRDGQLIPLKLLVREADSIRLISGALFYFLAQKTCS